MEPEPNTCLVLLASYDLRFPDHSTPTRTFKGHVNNYTQPLGICTDLNEDFLFAAGEDCRIRGWSLRTGEPLHVSTSLSSSTSSARSDDGHSSHPPITRNWGDDQGVGLDIDLRPRSSSHPDVRRNPATTHHHHHHHHHPLQNPFTSLFPNGTPVSAIQVTEEVDGMSLWAAAGQDLYEYRLGQVDGLFSTL
ncbi:hypothetical protein D9758_002613 [Tetrapyrgos nigripes]|uniref:Uncharacterized protein n=1 Tax=Tetrapyrgos nigripes TaxID=182062 RepID=A0A8H5GQC0_9AGAR|nr:hypothetical protein D9758_002613 [Tetrapyrgos nigripes]